MVGRTAARHTRQECVAFLAEVVADQPRGKDFHLIADKISVQMTRRVGQFPAANPKAYFHHTLTHSSWLNQVDNCFVMIECDAITHGAPLFGEKLCEQALNVHPSLQ